MAGAKLGMTGLSVHDHRLWGKYRAKVLNNNDPLELGRIKAEVIPYFVGIDPSIIPWAVPDNPRTSGAGLGTGTSAIPNENSMVWVTFEMGDIYQPVYGGEASDGVNGLPSFMGTNYPNRRGFQTSCGAQLYVDDTAEAIVASSPKDITVTAGRDLNATATSGSRFTSPEVVTTGNLASETGASGVFVTGSGQVVTVVDGVVTSTSGVLNQTYISNLITRIQTLANCSDLSDVQTRVASFFASLISQCGTDIAVLAPLLTPPATLQQVIIWIATFISTNILPPYTAAVALLPQLMSAYNTVGQALATANSSMVCQMGSVTDSLSVASYAALSSAGVTKQSFTNGEVDAYQDQTGINSGASTNQSYV